MLESIKETLVFRLVRRSAFSLRQDENQTRREAGTARVLTKKTGLTREETGETRKQ